MVIENNKSKNIGKEVELEIVDINYEGMGIAYYNDKTVFVSNALPKEKVKAKIDFENKNFYKAHTIDIINESSDRCIPICKNFPICGGCQLLHLNYSKTLEYKLNWVKNTLKRIGNVNFNVKNIVSCDEYLRYRNKVQIPIGEENNKLICGYYKIKSHDIIPFRECLLESKQVDNLIVFLKNICNEYSIKAYDESTKKGALRHFLIRENKNNELMIVFISNENTLDHKDEIVTKIVNKYPNVISIILNYNNKGNNVILGDTSYVLYGKDEIIDEILGLKFKISHYSFFQVNRKQTEKLYTKVLEYVGKKENVIDAYCGVGTISLALSKVSKHVYGIEVVKQAVLNAIENAKLNNITNVEFLCDKVENAIFDLLAHNKIDCVVIDPPRKGLDIKVIEALKQARIENIIYVSCNPSTLARDLGLLQNLYNIADITLFDMFAYTVGVESVCLLKLK